MLLEIFSINNDKFNGLLHCFSTCTEITGNNWYCFISKNTENCKEKFQLVKKLKGIKILISWKYERTLMTSFE